MRRGYADLIASAKSLYRSNEHVSRLHTVTSTIILAEGTINAII